MLHWKNVKLIYIESICKLHFSFSFRSFLDSLLFLALLSKKRGKSSLYWFRNTTFSTMFMQNQIMHKNDYKDEEDEAFAFFPLKISCNFLLIYWTSSKKLSWTNYKTMQILNYVTPDKTCKILMKFQLSCNPFNWIINVS